MLRLLIKCHLSSGQVRIEKSIKKPPSVDRGAVVTLRRVDHAGENRRLNVAHFLFHLNLFYFPSITGFYPSMHQNSYARPQDCL